MQKQVSGYSAQSKHRRNYWEQLVPICPVVCAGVQRNIACLAVNGCCVGAATRGLTVDFLPPAISVSESHTLTCTSEERVVGFPSVNQIDLLACQPLLAQCGQTISALSKSPFGNSRAQSNLAQAPALFSGGVVALFSPRASLRTSAKTRRACKQATWAE